MTCNGDDMEEQHFFNSDSEELASDLNGNIDINNMICIYSQKIDTKNLEKFVRIKKH